MEHTLLECLDRLYYTTISDKVFTRKQAYEQLKEYIKAFELLNIKLKENSNERGKDGE